MSMSLDQRIIIEMPNADRYVIEKRLDSYHLSKNGCTLCIYWEHDLISRKIFKDALEQILGIVNNLVKLDV